MNIFIKGKGLCSFQMIANLEGKSEMLVDAENNTYGLWFEFVSCGYQMGYKISEIEMLKTDDPIHTEFLMEMLNGVDDENSFELSEDGYLVNLKLLATHKEAS